MSATKTTEKTEANVPSQIPLWREPAVYLGIMGAIGGQLVAYLAGWFDPLIMR